jgi:glycosyltransferase involved in cell wall biosynthesis
VNTVLWWGRFDPDYSRNRILRELFAASGWVVKDFHPVVSGLGNLEASLRRIMRPQLVWVPCFRQRDVADAVCWARRQGVPLVFDPLISAYDKQVDERGKLVAGSRQADRLLAWERGLFGLATRVVADTPLHAEYFSAVLGVKRECLAVIYVGAEESLFRPVEMPVLRAGEIPEVLFYGSFIPLQGPQIIIEAARLYSGPPVRWTLIGKGPLHAACVASAAGVDTVRFEDWLPYEQLPARIARAQILLGIFGNTPKAARVIPNKVFQSLACGRPVITRMSDAYPGSVTAGDGSGLVWIPPGDARALAERVAWLAALPERMRTLGDAAAQTSQQYFSMSVLREQLSTVITGLSSSIPTSDLQAEKIRGRP